MHVAEGVDAKRPKNSRTRQAGIPDTDFLAVHAVGLDEDGVENASPLGLRGGLVSSSNHFLFGRTAPRRSLPRNRRSSGHGLAPHRRRDNAGRNPDRTTRYARFAHSGCGGTDRGAAPWRSAPNLDIGTRANIVVSNRPILEAVPDDISW